MSYHRNNILTQHTCLIYHRYTTIQIFFSLRGNDERTCFYLKRTHDHWIVQTKILFKSFGHSGAKIWNWFEHARIRFKWRIVNTIIFKYFAHFGASIWSWLYMIDKHTAHELFIKRSYSNILLTSQERFSTD